MVSNDLPSLYNKELSFFSYEILKMLSCKPCSLPDFMFKIRDNAQITELIKTTDICKSLCELYQRNLINVDNVDEFIDFYMSNKNNYNTFFIISRGSKLKINLSIKGAWVSRYEKIFDK